MGFFFLSDYGLEGVRSRCISFTHHSANKNGLFFFSCLIMEAMWSFSTRCEMIDSQLPSFSRCSGYIQNYLVVILKYTMHSALVTFLYVSTPEFYFSFIGDHFPCLPATQSLTTKSPPHYRKISFSRFRKWMRLCTICLFASGLFHFP